MADSTPQVYGFRLDDAKTLAGIARSAGLDGEPVVGGVGGISTFPKYLAYPAKVKELITARDDDTEDPEMLPGEGVVTLFQYVEQTKGEKRFAAYKYNGREIDKPIFNFFNCEYAVGTFLWVAYDAFGKLWVLPLEETTNVITFRLATTLTKSTMIAKATIYEQEGPGIPSTFTGAGEIQVHNLPRDDGGYEYKGKIGAFGRAALIAENRYKILSLQCPTKLGWCCCSSSSSSRPSRSSSSVSYNCNPSICYGQECAWVWDQYAHDTGDPGWVLLFACNYGCECVMPTRHGAYHGEPVVLCCTPPSSSLSSISYECPEYCNYEYCYWEWFDDYGWYKMLGCSNPTCCCDEPDYDGDYEGQFAATCCNMCPSSSSSSSSSSSLYPDCGPECDGQLCVWEWDGFVQWVPVPPGCDAPCICPTPVGDGDYEGQLLYLCCGSGSSSSLSYSSSSSSLSSLSYSSSSSSSHLPSETPSSLTESSSSSSSSSSSTSTLMSSSWSLSSSSSSSVVWPSSSWSSSSSSSFSYPHSSTMSI